MNEMEEFLTFGAVVKIRKEYDDDLYKFIELMKSNGFLREYAESFEKNCCFDKEFNEFSEDRFWYYVKLNNGNTRDTCIEFQWSKGFTWGNRKDYLDYDKDIVASKFIYHVNEILPDDISVDNLRVVPDSFHAQKSARARYYRYELINRRYKQAFDGDILRVKYELDVERMQTALNFLLGEHDFSSFKSSGTLNPSKICCITRADVERVGEKGDRVFIHLEGNRFLYNMVRTIVGTLLEIEGHKLPVEHMKNVLEARDRRKAGQTVSPYGLTLMRVNYPQM